MCNDCFLNGKCPHQDIFIKIIIEEYDNALGNPYSEACARFKERHKNDVFSDEKRQGLNKVKLKRNYTCFPK